MTSFTQEEAQSLPVRLTSPYARTAVVSPWGFDLVCEYEYEEGEAPIVGDLEFAHPGYPPNASLLTCSVNGQDIYEMLKPEQIERIEEAILEQYW